VVAAVADLLAAIIMEQQAALGVVALQQTHREIQHEAALAYLDRVMLVGPMAGLTSPPSRLAEAVEPELLA
jgi:hypothetical protein